jgi:hypothetical protein
VPTPFCDSAGESTISRPSSTEKGVTFVNRFDLNQNNIIKPTFATLTELYHKALEAYNVKLDEFFYSCYEVTRQGLILTDSVSIIIHKAEVTPKV